MKRHFLLSFLFLFLFALPVFSQTTRVWTGATPFTDSAGNVWQPDSGLFNAGVLSSACPQSTASGPDPGIYKSERYDSATTGAPNMVYTFPNLANGTYSVSLYFDECSMNSVGSRVFSVSANGAATPQILNLDVFALAGQNKPLVQTFTVPVTAGTLTLTFLPVANNPTISAISFFLQTPPPATLPAPPAFTVATATAAIGISCGANPPPPSFHSVALTWTASITADVANYKIYRGTVTGGPYVLIGQVAATVLTYTDITITSGATYYYVATAVDPNGESPFSNQVSTSIP